MNIWIISEGILQRFWFILHTKFLRTCCINIQPWCLWKNWRIAIIHLLCLQSTNIWLTINHKISMRRKLGLDVNSQTKDTVDNQKTKVPEQEGGEDEGWVAHNIPRGFMLLDTLAAPGGRHRQSEWCWKYDIMSSGKQLTHSLTAQKKNMSLKMTDSLWKSTVDGLA